MAGSISIDRYADRENYDGNKRDGQIPPPGRTKAGRLTSLSGFLLHWCVIAHSHSLPGVMSND